MIRRNITSIQYSAVKHSVIARMAFSVLSHTACFTFISKLYCS